MALIPGRHVAARMLRTAAAAALLACTREPSGPGSPTRLFKVSGDAQRGEVGAALAQLLIVRVVDKNDQPTPTVDVRFEVTEGAGSVNPASALTDATGAASTQWTLGPAAGSAHRVTASNMAPSLGTVSFAAEGTPAAADTLVAVSGSNQVGAPAQPAANPLIVSVRDRFGNPIPQQSVRFEAGTGGGRVVPETETTNARGEAQTQWTLGLSAGSQTARARVDGLKGSPVVFAADVTSVCAGEGLALRASFPGINDDTPSPDATIAAGPETLVLARNSRIAIRHKTGALLDQRTMGDFVASVRPAGANALTDPYVIYDPDSRRFFVSTADGVQSSSCAPGSCVSVILLAVSKSSTPKSLSSADWYFYSFDRTRNITSAGSELTNYTWGDFDHLGVTTHLLVIGMQMVRYEATGPQGSGKIRVLDKARLVRGDPVTTWIDFPELAERPLPALSTAITDRLFLFFRVSCALNAQLVMGAVEGTPSAPTLTLASVATQQPCFSGSEPLSAEQPGGLPVDVVYLNVAPAQQGTRFWIARTVGLRTDAGVITGVRWTEVDVSAWPQANAVQAGTLGGGLWRYTAALAVDDLSNLAVVHVGSSATTFPSAHYSGRLAADPPGTLREERILKAGTATHSHIELGRNRFTDYFSAVVDPVDQSFWVMGMYATGSLGSGTWVGNLVACR